MRFAYRSLMALLVIVGACTSDDNNDEQATGESESESVGSTADESDSETGEAACGAASGTCCAPMEACQATEDCCEQETYTCYLVGTSMQCADLAALCEMCMMNCTNVPPDVCEMGCKVFCDPSA